MTSPLTYMQLTSFLIFNLLQGPAASWETLHLQKHQRRHSHYVCVHRSWRSFCYWRASVRSPRPLASGTHTDRLLGFHVVCLYLAHLSNSFSLCMQILLTEEFVEQMLGDLQELNTREEARKFPVVSTFTFSLILCNCSWFTLYVPSLCVDKVTKGVQLARKEAEDLSVTRLCVWQSPAMRQKMPTLQEMLN